VLVGQKKAVAIAVRNASGRRRWSKLAEWLRPCLKWYNNSLPTSESSFSIWHARTPMSRSIRS
jgi:hypothetical protein